MEVDFLAEVLWNYLKLGQKLKPCSGIIVPGSHDNGPAHYAVHLFKNGYGKYLIFSGGVLQTDPNTYTKTEKTEAEVYAEIARKLGVPENRIHIESRAQNTAENLRFSLALAKEKGLDATSFMIVHKPYNERRLETIIKKQIPEMNYIITSEPTTFKEYTNKHIPKRYVIESMVGDVQRLKIYSENGFQIPVEIPKEVWDAYQALINLGYTKRMIECKP